MAWRWQTGGWLIKCSWARADVRRLSDVEKCERDISAYDSSGKKVRPFQDVKTQEEFDLGRG